MKLRSWSTLFGFVFGFLTAAQAEEFPTPYNSEPDTRTLPMSPTAAAAGFNSPPGFSVRVFASEPDVQNPIAMTWDGRGRLWVAENYTYAERSKRFDLHLRDRILIFDDPSNTGHFATRKVFTDELQIVTSVEVGHGGVWVLCPPQLLFIPDRNRDDHPDAGPEVVLDGFTIPTDNYHNFANGLRWGPDGWLYGRCGASAPGDVGSPGTPAAQRIPLRGTLWRYHPNRKVFEALSGGTTNPWGHDWDEYGELFFINTVNGHLWHEIPGAHYVRPHTIDRNSHVYGLIDQHADHWHFDTAQGWTKSRDGAANALGGGHAHIGALIYQGDNWPSEYRGHLFTWNMHGRRMNQEILVRSGSGYIAKHGTDVFLAADPWFRGMDLSTGPDGSVFALDWSDTGECHDSTGVHRTSGRIYQMVYGQPVAPIFRDLTSLSSLQLLDYLGHSNVWFSTQARLELQERGRTGADQTSIAIELKNRLNSNPSTVIQLRALWTLWGMGAADTPLLTSLLAHTNEHLRVWAIRLLTDSWPLDTAFSRRPGNEVAFPKNEPLLKEFHRLAVVDPSGLVRLALATALQRLPVENRVDLAAALVAHPEDATDHNLPWMIWYGLIPVADSNPSELVGVALASEIPIVRQSISRRLGEDVETHPALLGALLDTALSKNSEAFFSDIALGLSEAIKGWKKAFPPKGWADFQQRVSTASNPILRDQVRDISVIFGDGRALEEVRALALNPSADLDSRQAALRTLIESRPPDLRAICEKLLSVRDLNTLAIRALAQFDDADLGEKLARNYPNFAVSERGAVLDSLAARKSFIPSLLNAMEAGTIPHGDLTPFQARQIRSLNDNSLTQRLSKVWGEVREPSADKREWTMKLKSQLTADVIRAASPGRGRGVFNLTCAPCHTLYGHGGQIGPDLTGAGRDNLDYLLDNIVDPSAVVNADYRMSVLELKDGRILNGLRAATTERTLTLKSMNETVVIERSDIVRETDSTQSIMPEGILESLGETQVQDLIAYLMTRSQVPLAP